MAEETERVRAARERRPDMCGATKTTGSVAWVCIVQAHADAKSAARGPREGLNSAYVARADRHYFVRRWPYRKGDEDAS